MVHSFNRNHFFHVIMYFGVNAFLKGYFASHSIYDVLKCTYYQIIKHDCVMLENLEFLDINQDSFSGN